MATANLTWTNNSTGDNPTGTKVERSDNLDFSNASASPSEITSGSGGGLDPTAASGSYGDGTVQPYNHYAYRVSTLKGAEVSTSMSTPLQYVHDQDNELGYPNGTPNSAPTYNCSVEPQLHVDVSRLGGYDYSRYFPLASNSYEDRYFADANGSLDPVLRHNPIGAQVMNQGNGNRPVIGYSEINGVHQKYLGKFQVSSLTDDNGVAGGGTGNSGSFWLMNPGAPIGYKDEVTVFYVGSGSIPKTVALGGPEGTIGPNSGNVNKVLGTNVPGNGAIDGVYYRGATDGQASGAIMSWPTVPGILSYRHNNTLAAFNSAGGTGAQLFVNGLEHDTTGNNNSMSYHQSGTPAHGTHYGAYAFASGIHGYINFTNHNHVDHVAYEYIVFNSILNAADMNAVTGYLCNRYNFPHTQVTDSDLI